MVSFDTISNLYDAKSIVECYEGDASAPMPGVKDEKGDWNAKGHPDRIIQVTKKSSLYFQNYLMRRVTGVWQDYHVFMHNH